MGNFAHETTEDQLRKAFAEYGEVSSIKIVSDRRGRQKGFCLRTDGRLESASSAMESLKGTQINGRTSTSSKTRHESGFNGRRRR